MTHIIPGEQQYNSLFMKMIKNKTTALVVKSAGFLTTMFIAGLSGYVYANAADMTKYTAPEDAPIINIEARKAYEKGSISKYAAKKKINAQLNELVDAGEIKGWTCDKNNTYNKTLSNGTYFTYYLK